MSKLKAVLAGVLLLGIVVVKIIFPVFAEEITEFVQLDGDYGSVFASLGLRLADEGRELATFLGLKQDEPAPEPEPTATYLYSERPTIQETRSMALSLVTTRIEVKPEKQASEPVEPEPTEQEPEPIAPAVAAFHERQAEFAEYELPANVSLSAQPLPFAYVTPVSGLSSSGFGYRLHPIAGVVKYHYGTDFAAYSGTDIYAFAGGTVAAAGEEATFGNYLIIDHGDGYRSLYAHCSRLMVAEGATVAAGDLIALVGATGQVTGPHLHFELMQGESYLNPEFYLAVNG